MMGKKLLSLCLILAIVFSFSGALADSKKNDDYAYEVKGGGIKILKYLGNETDTIEVPSEIDGKPVKIIGQRAFEGVSANKIIFPETLTSVETSAMHGTKCKEIVFSETKSKLTFGVHSIEDSKVESLSFPSTADFKKRCPFFCDKLKSIYVDPNNKTYEVYENALITKKDKKLLGYAIGLVSDKIFRIPEGIKIIGSDAFQACIACDSIIIPDSVVTIEDYAFAGCDVKHLTIGSGVKKMGRGVFSAMFELVDVTISDGTTVIGKLAFVDCRKLESIVIPSSVKTIDKNAFEGNYTLKIIAEENSTAGKFAKKNGYELVAPETR